ncbi:MAG: cell division protein ZapA [Elusimicrobia bacterium]|nr:cell division protein ZapA [Elusimicrobiota bacterium]
MCKRDYRITNKHWQPLHVQMLADKLEKKLKNIEKKDGIIDSYALLVKASLELIDEKLKLQEKKAGSSQLIENEIDELISELDKTI